MQYVWEEDSIQYVWEEDSIQYVWEEDSMQYVWEEDSIQYVWEHDLMYVYRGLWGDCFIPLIVGSQLPSMLVCV